MNEIVLQSKSLLISILEEKLRHIIRLEIFPEITNFSRKR